MKKIILMIGLIGGVSLVIYTDSIISSESLYPQPGTYAYFVTVPSLIKSLPQPQLVVDSTTYYHSAGDGTKLPEDEVIFLSTATKENIFRQIGDYLAAKGLKKLNHEITETDRQRYVKEEFRVEVKVKSNQNGYHEVTVSKTY